MVTALCVETAKINEYLKLNQIISKDNLKVRSKSSESPQRWERIFYLLTLSLFLQERYKEAKIKEIIYKIKKKK